MRPKIMIIDDDSNLRRLYQAELSSEGYDVRAVGGATDAVQQLKDQPCDIVVLDIEMPEISGLELVTILKELAPNTKIIMNSAYPMYKSDFKSWLADAYLIKSSDINPLKKEIKQLTE